jgi:hypothetical protein
MTSAAKIAANRRNAQRSTGPRSAAGKARTRYNALHYRFSVPARYDPKTDAEVQGLAVHLSADTLEPCEQDLAMRAAEAQFDLFRMQRAKVDLINGIAKHLKYTDASLGEGDHLALAFMRKSKMLAAFDRYERRAASRRNRLLRKLRMLQELHRRRAAVERVGPPRPREHLREMPFVEDVVRLEIHRAVKAAIETGVKMTSPSGPPAFRVHWKWGPPKRQSSCIYVAELNADHGFLVLVSQQGTVQTFALSRIRGAVGGGQWLVRCPESGKMVKDLYLHTQQKHFRSRHALQLQYRTTTFSASYRHWERCEKLMGRIGATDFHILPPRPKYMRRATYHRLCDEITTERILMFSAHLGADRLESIVGFKLTRADLASLDPE